MGIFKKSSFKKVLLGILILIVVFVGILLFNTLRFESRQITAEPIQVIDIPPAAVDNFSKSLQIETISPENLEEFDSTQFKLFSTFLEATYPLTDSLLEKQVFNTFSYLYKWEGSDPGLDPIILLAHLDVVPVIAENLPDWKHKPFGGEIIEDTVWGRGAIDDKNVVISVMESTELLLKQGYQPKRGIYLAIVHDEEIGGFRGALPIANYLKEQGVKAEYILDEGGYITQGIIPDMDPAVALIGIAEKGFLSLELSVKIEGGHSSIPKKETAIDILAHAIATLKENPFPAKISPPIEGFIDYLGPELPFVKKMVFANSAIFSSMIIGVYEEKPSGNALVRTTTAPTIFNSGLKDNVVPQFAKATINFRILPGESVASVVERVKTTMDDERISIKINAFQSEPSSVSDTASFGFTTVQKTIAQVYPGMIVSPYLMVGATDSRHFNEIAKTTYRFTPITIFPENIKSFHGLNERLSVTEFENSIRFYVQLIKNSTGE